MKYETAKAIAKAHKAEAAAQSMMMQAVCLQAEEYAEAGNPAMAERYRRTANNFARFAANSLQLSQDYEKLSMAPGASAGMESSSYLLKLIREDSHGVAARRQEAQS